MISKTAGGIGMSIHNIPAVGSYIAGTNGYSNGFVSMLHAYDATARYVDPYDWSKGHAGMAPGAPNKILLHLVKEDVSKKRK
ncbi:hypothetical protein Clacol_010191 [Clathrus columnatus]|uniref:Ribonucleotide reductase large subunit C-terminal domain-containing protein n=1 Tax=Clathrus columnatus TaxID=1419009 RepID=A0AAV5ATE6_9AGAM|nr:hypothetical protein Clacol_010191 [Clathrus columnatus]